MTKQYTISEEKKDQVKKINKKNSRLWRNMIPVRILIWVCYPFIPIFLYFVYRDNSSMMRELFNYYMGILYFVGYSIIPILFYSIMLNRVINWNISRKMYESFILYDDRIYNLYHPHNESYQPAYDVWEIYYSEIEKIEYNEQFRYLKIIAPVHVCIYDNLNTDSIKKQGILNGEKGFRVIYLYYEQSEDLVKEIGERSGKTIQRISEKDMHLKECRI